MPAESEAFPMRSHGSHMRGGMRSFCWRILTEAAGLKLVGNGNGSGTASLMQ
jgi:hypothetical protein